VEKRISESFAFALFGETKDAIYEIKSGSQILFSVSIKAYGSIMRMYLKQITAQDSYAIIKYGGKQNTK
jgi:hypothetical protein